VSVQVDEDRPEEIAGHELGQQVERFLLGERPAGHGVEAQERPQRGQLRSAELDIVHVALPPERYDE
jgi:hypothetical protein